MGAGEEDGGRERVAAPDKSGLIGLIEDYRLCAMAEGKSPNYICLMRTTVNLFRNYLMANRLPTEVTLTNAEDIRGFFRHLQSVNKFSRHPYAHPQLQKLSGHAINTYARTLRAFWSWLEAEDIIGGNPFQQVRVPRAPNKLIAIFAEDQIRAILSKIDITTATGFRDHTIILLLLDTMMRVSELTGCTLPDMDLENREIRVWGKGSKQRTTPFGKTAQKALWKYVRSFRPDPELPNQNRLFLTADGRPLTKNRVEAILKHYGTRAGIVGVRVSPHTLRHTGAVMFLRNGGDVFTLQKIMGHSSLETLKAYINLSQGDISRVHARASPVDNLALGVASVKKPVRNGMEPRR
jgi:integrase/recombinase XerD